MHESPEIEPIEDRNRRSFLCLTTAALATVGAGFAAWRLVDSMNPAADVAALYPVKVDMVALPEGQSSTVVVDGLPVFIRHRTQSEIEAARNVYLEDLPYPEEDSDRVLDPRWIAVIGLCTRLKCVLYGQRADQSKGAFGGWFCPCCASHYDTSGRFRRGIAPKNLQIPAYDILNGTILALRSVPRTPD